MKNKIMITLITIMLLVGMTGNAVAPGNNGVGNGGGANPPPNPLPWTGQGTTNGVLNDNQCDSRNTPYLLWIFTTGGGNPTGSEGLYINGVLQNTGTVHGTEIHFETGLFDLTTLTAYVAYDSSILGNGNPQLTISHGCTGRTEVPEFPTIALPIAAIIGLVFFFQNRKKKEE